MSKEVYILAGQSNMVGVNNSLPTPTYANGSRIYRFNQPWHSGWNIPVAQPTNTGSWALANDPLHADPQCGVGPGKAFADKLIDLRGDPSLEIGLVPCAWGGSDIRNHWGSSYLWWNAFGMMLGRMAKAKEWGEVKGFIWYQGEADALNAAPTYYQTELFRLVRDVRSYLGIHDLPVIVTRLGPNPGGYPGWASMQSYIDQVAGVDPNLAVVSASDLAASGVHLTAASAVTLGHRYAAAMNAML